MRLQRVFFCSYDSTTENGIMFLFLLLGLLMGSLKLSSVTIMQSLKCLDMKICMNNQVDGFLMLKYSVLVWLPCSLQTECSPKGFRLNDHSSSLMVLPMSHTELESTHSVLRAAY